jgi:hypothetical protein
MGEVLFLLIVLAMIGIALAAKIAIIMFCIYKIIKWLK